MVAAGRGLLGFVTLVMVMASAGFGSGRSVGWMADERYGAAIRADGDCVLAGCV